MAARQSPGLPGTLVTVYDPGIYLLILPVISRYEYRIEGSMLGADNGPTILEKKENGIPVHL